MQIIQSIQTHVNRTLIAFCVLSGGIGHAATPNQSTLVEDARVFRAICMWEHRGHIRPEDVSSANAHGPAQIRQIYLDDANEYLGTEYSLADCHEYLVAFEVVRAYWARYNLKTPEQRVRAHYGGPRGYRRACTLEYWQGVQTYL